MAEELASLSLAISPGAPAADAAFGSQGTSSSPRGGRRGSSGRSMPSKSAPNDDLDEDRRAMHIAAESHTPETHVVAEGDTLGMIAGVYGVPVFTIEHVNDLHPDSILYPGDVLRVPSPLFARTHVVAPGDSLHMISDVYDVPVESILLLNGLRADSVIHPGAVLRVASPRDGNGTRGARRGKKTSRRSRRGAVASSTSSNHAPTRRSTSGPDPLSSAIFGVVSAVARGPDEALKGAWGLVSAGVGAAFGLVPGARRVLGGRAGGGDGGGGPNGNGNGNGNGSTQCVTVKRGESLASIAQDNGLSVRALQRMNGITSDALDTGETLRVAPLDASERCPRLRRSTRRHLFQSTAEVNARGYIKVTNADRMWRAWGWRWEPRGEEGRAFFGRRIGLGRGGRRDGGGGGDACTGKEIARAASTADAVVGRDCEGNANPRAVTSETRPKTRTMQWEHRRRASDSARRWHPSFVNPVCVKNNPFIASGFGMRWDRMHAGVDVAANEGTRIRAAARGRVYERTYDETGYGWLLKIDHGEGW